MTRFFKILAIIVAVFVVAVLAMRTPDTDPQEMHAKYGAPPSQFADLGNGQTVHLRDEGPRDAPAIILLHGSNSSLHTWDEWVVGLADRYRVIRFDQVGHGLTGAARNGDYSKARHVADVGAVADYLGIDTFVIAGNSMGGWVSAAYAVEHPGRLNGLGLLNASGAPRKDDEGRLYLGAVLASIPVVNSILTIVTPRSLVAASYEGSVANRDGVTDEKIDRYWELLRYPGNRQAVIDRANTPRGGPFNAAEIAGIATPSLIMWGQEDQVTPVRGARWYAQHLANNQSIIYPDVAHVPMEEAPQQSVADFRKWLDGLKLTIQNP